MMILRGLKVLGFDKGFYEGLECYVIILEGHMIIILEETIKSILINVEIAEVDKAFITWVSENHKKNTLEKWEIREMLDDIR